MSIKYLISYCKEIPNEFEDEGQPTLADFAEDAEKELAELNSNSAGVVVGKVASSHDVLLAESYIVKYDEYISIENNIDLPMEIDFSGNLKIYVDKGYAITKAVNGWGDSATDVIGKKVEIYKKILSK